MASLYLYFQGIAKAAPVPNTWAKPFDEYRNFLVTPGSPEFLQVKENFERTIGDRKYQGILEVRIFFYSSFVISQ